MTRGAAFDVQAVCAGFIFALAVADNFIAARAGAHRPRHRRRDVLAHPRLGGPRHLRAVRRRRRRRGADARCRQRHRGDRGILSTHLHSDGRHYDILYVDGGPSSTRHAPAICAWRGARFFATRCVNLSRGRSTRRSRANGLTAARYRLAGAAPGEQPHHRRDRTKARPARRQDRHDDRAPRQHLGRLDPAGPGRGGRRRTHTGRATSC